MPEIKVNRFYGGMQNDIRSTLASGCRLSKNMDILTYPFHPMPYRASEEGNNTPTRELTTFLYSGGYVWGLGVAAGTERAKIFRKNTFTDGTWDETSNNASSTGTRDTDLFVQYSYGGANYIFGAHTGNIYRYNMAGTEFAETHQPLSYTIIGQGLVHSKDNVLYIPYDNIIARNNAGSWTTAALTLPAQYVITSLCEYGNYLAILCKPALTGSGKTNSVVFLWDRDSTVATLSESIDLGAGNYEILEEYQGNLVAIGSLHNKLIVREGNASGFGDPFIFDTANAVGTIGLQQVKQKANNRIYFIATDFSVDSAVSGRLWGVLTVGKNPEGGWALSLDRTPANDTDPNSLQGFFLLPSNGLTREIMLIAYSDGSSNKQVSMTHQNNVYSATAVYETLKFSSPDLSFKKKLKGVTVTHAPLPANASVVLKYKIDAETSFTTIFTHTTEDSLSHSAINIESSGANLPEFNEIQFRLETTVTSGSEGPIEITSLSLEYDLIGKRLY